jgi:hypothetical protein
MNLCHFEPAAHNESLHHLRYFYSVLLSVITTTIVNMPVF